MIASMLEEGEVQNVSKIYMVALCCILLSPLIEYKSGTFL